MSTSKKAPVNDAKAPKTSVPPAPQPDGAPASFAPNPRKTPPKSEEAKVVGSEQPSVKRTSAVPQASGGSAEASSGDSVTGEPKPVIRPDMVGPRRVRLTISRIDPWSAMKMSFLLSIAVGIMMVVASIVFWNVLDGMHVFTEIDQMMKDIIGDGGETEVNILQYVELSRVVSLATIIAVIDIVLLTALGTIGAFLYNVVAALVGGIHLTMTDD
ncbi:DUF3566 domain-containing protein [Timonella sp. A28]|uniref:DUF3566 domain-containing protein n=1 Tax=Timonella sp. A28 TaxID=3442640 RepID=UPI003EB95F10